MRILSCLLLSLASACAARAAAPAHPPPTPTRYLFLDTVPDDTLICVPREPLALGVGTEPHCLTITELRQWLRRRRYARGAEAIAP